MHEDYIHFVEHPDDLDSITMSNAAFQQLAFHGIHPISRYNIKEASFPPVEQLLSNSKYFYENQTSLDAQIVNYYNDIYEGADQPDLYFDKLSENIEDFRCKGLDEHRIFNIVKKVARKGLR